jgi:DNA-binding GntR family transcriptional regulator
MQNNSLTLADQAYDLVEQMIVTLELVPGSIFSENELSERIGIGRTPLREALQRLAEDRLVMVLPRKGLMVTEINFVEYLALLETRRVLDHLVATKAARRATPEQRHALCYCAASMRDVAHTSHLDEFMRLDRACDEILEAASRNPFATKALGPLHAHCRRFWYRYQHGGDLARSAELHTGMMLAVAEGDGVNAGAASDAIIGYLEEFTREALELP